MSEGVGSRRGISSRGGGLEGADRVEDALGGGDEFPVDPVVPATAGAAASGADGGAASGFEAGGGGVGAGGGGGGGAAGVWVCGWVGAGFGATGFGVIGMNSPGRHMCGCWRIASSRRKRSACPQVRQIRVPSGISPRDRSDRVPPLRFPVFSSLAQTKSLAPQLEHVGATMAPLVTMGGFRA